MLKGNKFTDGQTHTEDKGDAAKPECTASFSFSKAALKGPSFSGKDIIAQGYGHRLGYTTQLPHPFQVPVDGILNVPFLVIRVFPGLSY